MFAIAVPLPVVVVVGDVAMAVEVVIGLEEYVIVG